MYDMGQFQSGVYRQAGSKEVNTVLNSLSNADDFEIIICKTVDPCMIEYLEESGCEVKYDYHAS